MRYTGPTTRLARREQADLGLKSKPVDFGRPMGDVKKGGRPKKQSEFGQQLRAKQLAKRLYGVSEKYFRNLFQKASDGRHPTGPTFLSALERRLDNVVYKAGFAKTRAQARQMVTHRAFLVNGKRMDIPSYQVKVNDVITVREKSIDHPVLREMEGDKTFVPEWLSVNLKKRTIEVTRLPEQGDSEQLINIQAIIEFYSR